MGRRRLRRLGAAVAGLAVVAGLGSLVVGGDSDDRTPAPVVWRDHVVEPSTTTAP